MKYFGVIAFLALFAVCAYSRNMTWGFKGPYDVILFKTNITKPGQWNRYATHNGTFPIRAGANQRIITQVRAIDLIRNGTGGEPLLTRGGPNQKFVTVMFTSSKPGRGLNFTMEIWGRK